MRLSLFPSSIVVIAFGTISAQAQTTFIDVQATVGITFTHEVDSECSSSPLGSGSSWADYDDDGDIDLYVTNMGGPSRLYQNQGDTNGDELPDFVDIAPMLDVDLENWTAGVVFIDYDNDGDQDLYVTRWGGNHLFKNLLIETDSATFEDVTAFAGVGDADRCITAAWADYDRDGWVDLYLAKHFDCLPNIEESRDALFKNNGDGTFADVSHYLCADGSLACEQLNEGHAITAGWFDYDNDGDPDLYIANDVVAYGYPNIFYRNDGPDGVGGWTFTEVSLESGTDYAVNCFGLGIGDYDNDGWYDIAFGHARGGFLLRNRGDETFEDVSVPAGIRCVDCLDQDITWGTVFFDYDNDGWLDLFYVSGMINGVPIPQPDMLFRNNQDGTFADVSVEAGVDDDRRGRSASICDFDQDGFVDLFVGNYGQPADLWHNESYNLGNTNHWLTITAEGIWNNRDGIGTRFYLTTPDGITQIREITSGPTHGGGDHKVAYFGLGQHTSATLTVRWPIGGIQELGTVTADQHLHVWDIIEDVSGRDPTVTRYHLFQNYPNPFNPATTFTFSLPASLAGGRSSVFAYLAIYDLLGREIATLVNEKLAPGTYTRTWDATGQPSGVYFYRLSTTNFVQTKKLVLLR